MSAHSAPMTKDIHIKVLQHRQTGLMMAYSEQVKGLLVPGRTPEELGERLPDAIREILEAQGFTVLNVNAIREEDNIPAAFAQPKFTVSASILEN